MYKRIIVLGIDGIDPGLAEQFMQQGDLPHLSALRQRGSYSRLATSNPPQSPVAWCDIGTGTDSGTHGIFDFIQRNPKNYLPDLSILKVRRANNPAAGETVFEAPCRARFFWEYTAAAGIPSYAIRWPMTFPPAAGNSTLLSGLGVPDIKGDLGRYTCFSTKPQDTASAGEDRVVRLLFNGATAEAEISGPHNAQERETAIPFTISTSNKTAVSITIGQQTFSLQPGEWSGWIELEFPASASRSISAAAKFYLVSIEPQITLYLSPLQINPVNPYFPLSSPAGFSRELADAIGGPYYTQGIPEDTKPLTEGVIGDDAFIELCEHIMAEREQMLRHCLGKFTDGVFSFVIDTTDRIQHIFWRFLDTRHPLYEKKGAQKYGGIIRDYYKRADKIIGEIVRGHVDDKTLLLVLSDHGFTTFRKGVNLNRWLIENNYMTLREEPDPDDKEGGSLFKHVDWRRTSAYALGFSSIYLNLKGREASGMVQPGSEAEELAQKIARDLLSLKDPSSPDSVIKQVYAANALYTGEYRAEAPDLVVGFNAGYRMSWQTAIGGAPRSLLEPNRKQWSGDHIVDPSVVPGVLFCNRKISAESSRSLDIAPTVLTAMGISPPAEIKGKSSLF
jgi:predicted AlkP superfamily phosphohydrolase/phosphomutase